MKRTPLEPWIVKRANLKENTQKALRAYQLERLVQTLAYAKEKSRFYKSSLAKIEIQTIRSLKDFSKIPFTTPKEIKKNSQDFLCVSAHEIERIVTLNTSGTTGDEKRIFFSQEDLALTIDFFQHGMNSLIEDTDKVMVLLPGSAFGSIGDLLKKALSRSHIECIVQGVLNDVEATALSIVEQDITCLVGIPMQIFYLSKVKPELFSHRISKVLLSTDYVPNALVQTLSRQGCLVYNHYGMTEMGYGGGVECGCLNGYHLRENDLYFEIVDPVTGEVVEDGTYGEVVFTMLNRQAMPLIRYKTGDTARFITEPCACGTFLRRMDKVLGRIENKIHVNGHDVHLREMDEIVLGFAQIIDYQLSAYDNDTLDLKLVFVRHTHTKELVKEIVQRIREHFAFAFLLTLEIVEDDGSPTMTRSMVKRTLQDYRQTRSTQNENYP